MEISTNFSLLTLPQSLVQNPLKLKCDFIKVLDQLYSYQNFGAYKYNCPVLWLYIHMYIAVVAHILQGISVQNDKFEIIILVGLSYIRKHSRCLACTPFEF